MRLLFWLSAFLVFFAYAGYPILVYVRARLWPVDIQRASIFPRVSIVLAAINEERSLPAKLANLASLDYPSDLLEIIVVSDGSTDTTNQILAAWEGVGRRAIFLPEHWGKAVALNCGVAEAKGEIVLFTDARQMISADALKKLVADFADPSVGGVSGELVIGQNPSIASSEGFSLYWHMEKALRNWEGLAGSTVGATGALYAVRRNLLRPIPQGTILDDVYIPLQVVRQGERVIFEREAFAWDDFKPTAKQELRRKVRTLVGNYQLLQLAPWVVTHPNSVRVQFICHKLLRLFVPFALVGLLLSTIWLRTGIYNVALAAQLVFYALASLSAFRAQVGFISRWSNISLAFIMLNTAAAIAFVYFITKRKPAWEP